MIHADLLSASSELRTTVEVMSRSGLRRRDTWASRVEALDYFRARGVWKIWDVRALELYVVRISHSVQSTLGFS